MFGCCCVNKKALKKELAKNELKSSQEADAIKSSINDGNDKASSPQKAPDATSPISEGKADKSNSSEEGNNFNLSGLIMSDGLVGMWNMHSVCWMSDFVNRNNLMIPMLVMLKIISLAESLINLLSSRTAHVTDVCVCGSSN